MKSLPYSPYLLIVDTSIFMEQMNGFLRSLPKRSTVVVIPRVFRELKGLTKSPKGAIAQSALDFLADEKSKNQSMPHWHFPVNSEEASESHSSLTLTPHMKANLSPVNITLLNQYRVMNGTEKRRSFGSHVVLLTCDFLLEKAAKANHMEVITNTDDVLPMQKEWGTLTAAQRVHEEYKVLSRERGLD